MANIKLGALVADIRGSIGGTCFSRGGGGSIARNAPKPCNPRSALQSKVRATLAQIAAAWSGLLDAAERAAWNEYAANTSWTNKVGTSANISGMAAFARLNALRIQGSLAIQEAAPTQYGHAGTPAFTITADTDEQEIAIALPGAPYVDTETDHHMFYFVVAPTSGGRAAIPSASRFKVRLPGTAQSVYPVDIESNWTFNPGQIVRVGGIFIDEYSRVGAPHIAAAIAPALTP